MVSSSGKSSGSGSTQIQNSGSEGNLTNQVIDQRKRRRMESNRQSARRSRMRKQKHLDDLMNQVGQLRKENSQILISINLTSEHYLNVESENSILRVQMMELNQRLQSLDEILNCINTNNGVFNLLEDDDLQIQTNNLDEFLNPWSLLYVNQPVMASANIFQY